MRILLVGQSYHPYRSRGGLPTKLEGFARALIARGHAVAILTSKMGAAEWPVDGSLPRFRQRGVTRAKLHGVEVTWLPVVLRYRDVTLNAGLGRFYREELPRFDAVHLFGLYDLLGPRVARACRRLRIPYVVEPMGMFKPIVRSFAKKRVYHRLLGGALLGGAARLIATAENEKQEIAVAVPLEKIAVRRNGIDTSPFERGADQGRFRREIGIPPTTPLVLFLGRLSQKKGADILIDAVAKLGADAHVAIVGPDDGDGTRAALAAQIGTLGLGARVSLHEGRFGQERLDAFADADIFVLPSRHENFGNTVIEAMAAGVPVVVTDRCGVAPLVDGKGARVVPCDASAIRGALEGILASPSARLGMREQGRLRARELSWEEPAKEAVALYAALRGGP